MISGQTGKNLLGITEDKEVQMKHHGAFRHNEIFRLVVKMMTATVIAGIVDVHTKKPGNGLI